MKQLQGTLRRNPPPPHPTHSAHERTPRQRDAQKWSLDPDLVEQAGSQEEKLSWEVQELLRRKFESEKYLEEETFLELLSELTAALAHMPSQLHRLLALERTLPAATESVTGELRNYLKHFQSLLDAKIRKLKKKEKRTELVEFQRLADQQAPRRRQPVTFINEDDHHRLPRTHLLHDEAKRSFGTINSNQTESNSARNKSGSDSRSGEGNALAVLLANVRPEDKQKEKQKGRAQREKYEFSALLGGSLTVRQRHHPVAPSAAEAQAGADQDEAFIFHRPRPTRR